MKLISFFLIVLTQFVFAQKESSVWCFGRSINLDFNSQPPSYKSGNNMYSFHTSSSICDKNGNLLFYTDGISVWNRKHQKMPHGNNSIQGELGTLIVPKPNNDKIFYLFTVSRTDTCKSAPVNYEEEFVKVTTLTSEMIRAREKQELAWSAKTTLYYSVIDLSKENGLGDVINVNIILESPVLHQITAIRHQNDKDFWLITHKLNSNVFLSYLIDKNGIQKNPIQSTIGRKYFPQPFWTNLHKMRASLAGNKIVMMNFPFRNLDLFDFDNQKGMVSNAKELEIKIPKCINYGFEFSTDASKLYITAYEGMLKRLGQVDLSLSNASDISKSLKYIDMKTENACYGMQLAPDGKIYITIGYNSKENHLAIIHQPNESLEKCEFKPKEIFVGKTGYNTHFPMITHLLSRNLLLNKKNTIQLDQYFTRPILFEVGKAIIQKEYLQELQDIIQFLQNNPHTKIEIIGHTDNQGDKMQNQLLSEKRAKAVADYLISKGVHKNRIAFSGLGDTKPIADNNTIVGKAKNRRIEFLIK